MWVLHGFWKRRIIRVSGIGGWVVPGLGKGVLGTDAARREDLCASAGGEDGSPEDMIGEVELDIGREGVRVDAEVERTVGGRV